MKVHIFRTNTIKFGNKDEEEEECTKPVDVAVWEHIGYFGGEGKYELWGFTIDVNTLEDLLEIVGAEGEIIINKAQHAGLLEMQIEIYDDYRE